MHCSRTRRADADAQLTGILSVTAGHKSGTLFVMNQDELDLPFPSANRIQNVSDLVSRKTEDNGHSPFHKLVGQKICGCLRKICRRVLGWVVRSGCCLIFGRAKFVSEDSRGRNESSAANRSTKKLAPATAGARGGFILRGAFF